MASRRGGDIAAAAAATREDVGRAPMEEEVVEKDSRECAKAEPNTRTLLWTAVALARTGLRQQPQPQPPGGEREAKPTGDATTRNGSADMAWMDASRLLMACYEREAVRWEKSACDLQKVSWELLADEFQREQQITAREHATARIAQPGDESAQVVVSRSVFMEGKPTGRVPACLAPKREAHEPNGDSVAPLSSSARDRGGVADGWNSRSHEVVAPKAEAPRGASSHGAVPPGRAASVGGNARADSALLPHQRLFTSAPRAKVARTSEPKASVGARNGTAIPTERKAPRQFNMRNLERPPPAVVAPKRDARTSSTHDDEGERRSLSFGEWRQSSGSREKEGRMGRRGRSPPPVGNAFMTARSRYHGDVDPERADDASTRHGAAAAPDPSLVQPYRPPAFTSTTGSRPARAGEKGRRQPVTGGGGDDTKTFSNRTLTLLKLGADDELPETLEGLDRQFIERVCNEVVGTGVSLQWDDIAGCTETKKIIQEVVLYPIINPSLFTGILSPPKGILLFGPPGTGKTMIGKAIASNIHATFFSISATSLTSKWIGEGEMMVRTLFAVARHVEPSVIFIDEIDSLLSSRKSDGEHESSRKMKNQFLVEMDGVSNGKAKNSLLIVGATNRPEEIDEAARRRLPKQIYVPLPDHVARRELIVRQLALAKNGYSISERGIDNIVRKTDGYSGSDLKQVIQEAAMQPVREVTRRDNATEMSHIQSVKPEDTRALTIDDFKLAVHTYSKSVSETEIWRYEQYDKLHGTRIEARIDAPSQHSEGWSE